MLKNYNENLLNSLKHRWNKEVVTIIEAHQPFSLETTFIKASDLFKHQWYLKKYKDYFFDKHSDIQLTTNNLPDILRNRTYLFISNTELNSNNVVYKGLDRWNDNLFLPKDDNSGLMLGLFSFSKAFLLKNYIGNLSQVITNLLFEGFCEFNQLNPYEWVFQGSLHKNTSLFHYHFRMYQIKGTKQFRENNFSASCMKYCKNKVEAYFKQNATKNNETHKIDFKIQQTYIKYASQTSLMMNLMNNLFDLALATKDNFEDYFKQWLVNYLAYVPSHQWQYQRYQEILKKELNQIFLTKQVEINSKIQNGDIKASDGEILIKKWSDATNELFAKKSNEWINNFLNEIFNKVVALWKSQIIDVIEPYEDMIKKEQNYHTIPKNWKDKSFIDFCNLTGIYRKRWYKGILYLSSFWLMDNLKYDDSKELMDITNYAKTLSSLRDYDKELEEIASKQDDRQITWNNLNYKINTIPPVEESKKKRN